MQYAVVQQHRCRICTIDIDVFLRQRNIDILRKIIFFLVETNDSIVATSILDCAYFLSHNLYQWSK